MRITSLRARPSAVAQLRAAPMTTSAFGHRSTREFNDLTGISDRLFALQLTIMLKWRAAGMTVCVSSRHIKIVKHLGFFHQRRRHTEFIREFAQQFGNHVPPCVLSLSQMNGLYCLFGRLLCREACPLMK